MQHRDGVPVPSGSDQRQRGQTPAAVEKSPEVGQRQVVAEWAVGRRKFDALEKRKRTIYRVSTCMTWWPISNQADKAL